MEFSIFRRLSDPLVAPKTAQKTALTCGDCELTFTELNAWSSALAARLHSAGIGESRTVGLLAPSSLEYVAGLIAIWKAGGIAVPLQTSHPISELRYILEDGAVGSVLVHPGCREQAEALTLETPFRSIVIDVFSQTETRETAHEFMNVGVKDGADGALMIYTSGTTRRPKGVVTSFMGLEAQIRSLTQAWCWETEDRTINVLPLHHVHGIVNVLCCALATGARCEMLAKFDPQVVWNRIIAREITVFMAVPTVYSRLLEHWRNQDESTRSFWTDRAREMRLMVSGSAALPVPLFEAWERASGHRLLERYGMTEIGMALSNPLEGPRVPGSVGMPLPGVEVRLVDENGRTIEEANQAGEIQVKGSGVFRGYWRLPEITNESFAADGWFKTGDMAERNDQGFYRILGRLSQDIIKSGGYKISALEIESALLEHGEILEAAVVGVSDERWGERVAAAYVAKVVLNETECAEFLKLKLAHYKVPTLWKKVEALPRNAMGKVLKPDVRKLF